MPASRSSRRRFTRSRRQAPTPLPEGHITRLFHELAAERNTPRRMALNCLLDRPKHNLLDGAIHLAEAGNALQGLADQAQTLSDELQNTATVAAHRALHVRTLAEAIAINHEASYRLLTTFAAARNSTPSSIPGSAQNPIDLTAPADTVMDEDHTTLVDDPAWQYCDLCNAVRPPHSVADCRLPFFDSL